MNKLLKGSDMGARARLASVAVALAVTLGACGSGAGDAPNDKYRQTWTKAYSATTCTEWGSEMSERQRWAAAADMLVNGREMWGTETLPADSLVEKFKRDVSLGCGPIGTVTIGDTAASLLLIGGQREYGD